jgi:hypothetical protein
MKPKRTTTARHKLNVAVVFGASLVAGLAGAVSDSWAVFLLTAAILLVGAYYDGSIRT